MFDTLRYAQRLEELGVPRNIAEGHVRILVEVVEDSLVTKDVLKAELKELELRLIIRLSAIMGLMGTIFFAALSASISMMLKTR